MTRRREATRERLLTAAMEVFAEKGFHGASVEQICERAGFTPGAFDSNLAALDDLVIEPYEHHARRLATRVQTLSTRGDLSAEQILAAVLDVWSETPGREDQWYLLQVEFTLHAIRNKQVGRIWAPQQSTGPRRSGGLGRTRRRPAPDSPLGDPAGVRPPRPGDLPGGAQRLVEPRSLRRGSLERRFLPWCWRPSR